MMSLFSSFDYFWCIFPNFFELIFVALLFSFSYKISSSSIFLRHSTLFIFKFFSSLSSSFSVSAKSLFFTIMFFILSMNLFSVFPFSFPHTSQVGVVFFSGLSVWMSFLLFSLSFNLKGFLSHLVPEGSPLILAPILLTIELVSSLIRPITLSVRLVANILAGHLLLILLSKVVFCLPLSFPLYFGLNMVEVFVALIQSYIFVTMITLYFCDVS